MSRIKRFAHSLASGYALLAINVVYTFLSARVAVSYLSNADFGLWAVITQISGYLLLIDLGMAGSVSRILIDHKDDQQSDKYGSVIQTGFWVTITQGLLVAVLGMVVSFWLPQMMKLEPAQWSTARQVMAWQCGFLALSFCGRIVGQVLQAHQRFDLLNYSQMLGLALSFVALWFGFHQGWGLYSQVFAGAVSLVCSISVLLAASVRLRLFPKRGRWGRPSLAAFRELFAFGSDLFLLSLGLQLATASQAMILGRTLGMETAAVWANLTKTFVLGQQFVGRIFDFSSSALSEMAVRGEQQRLKNRFREIFILTASVSVLAGVGLATCNSAFVSIWLKNRFAWEPQNNWLMAGFLIALSISRCHVGLLGQTKDIGNMRYIYFLEGICFVCASLLIAKQTGITGVIAAAILCNLAWSGASGVRRTAQRFHLSIGEVLGWMTPALRMVLALAPLGILLAWLTRSLTPAFQLSINCPVILIVGLALLWMVGLNREMQTSLIPVMRKIKNKLLP